MGAFISPCRPTILIVSMLAMGLGCAERSPTAPVAAVAPATPTPAASGPTIVFLGDSIAAGLGLEEAQAFPAVVGELLASAGYAAEIVNAGVSGDTSAGGLRRLDWLLRQDPDVMVVELGANDALRGQDLQHTEANLRQIVQRSREAGARVVLLGMDLPTNYGPDYTRAFAELYHRIAEEEQVRLLPGFIREVGTDPKLMQADGLHPTAEGQRRLAETVAPLLESVLDEMELEGTPRVVGDQTTR